MPSAERYWREQTNKLAREASIRVTETYMRYAQGSLALDEAIGVQAALIAGAQRRAVTFNDVLLAAELTQRLEGEYAATGVQWMETPEQQTARLAKAASTVIGDDVAYVEAAAKGKTREQVLQLQAYSVRQRLDRLTTSEVYDASQWARQAALTSWEDQGVIVGWYRRLNPNACKFCRMLGGLPNPEAYIHSATSRMPKHEHCRCSQGWVTEVEPWQKFVGSKQQMKTIAPPEVEPPAPLKTPLSVIKVTAPEPNDLVNLQAERDQIATKLADRKAKQAAAKQAAADRRKAILGDASLTEAERAFKLKTDWELRKAKREALHQGKWVKALQAELDPLQSRLDEATSLASTGSSTRVAEIATWTLDEPLDVKDAALGANPLYTTDKQAKINCGRCVQAYELRRRGLQVAAQPLPKSLNGTSLADMEELWRTPEGLVRKFRSNLAGKTVMDALKLQGPGARGFVWGPWKGSSSSHVWNYEVDDTGKVWFVEAQSGKGRFEPDEYLKLLKPGKMGFLRVDDLEPTQFVADFVTGG